MSKVIDQYDNPEDFSEILDLAEANASSSVEIDFVADMREKHTQYMEDMYLSYKQREWLEKLAGV